MTEGEEAAYERGRRACVVEQLRLLLKQLGYEGRTLESLVLEREATIAVLRSVCAEHGDNDWDDHLHLADVVEKHLRRHLGTTP